MARCDSCTVLDFQALFIAPATKPSVSLPPVIWRDILTLRKNHSCELCQLILRTFELNPKSQAFKGKSVAAIIETFAQRGILPGFGRRLWITVKKNDHERVENAFPVGSFDSDYGYCIQPVGQQNSLRWEKLPSLQARTVNQHHVDSDLVRGWLDLCAECHSGQCAPILSTEPRKFNFRVIDVAHSQVVSAPDDCMYAALSYVWGPAMQVMNKKDIRATLTTPGGMDHLPIPRTIRDSMEFCKAIGYTYLWVDALCIEQDELDDLESQIAAMDQVYSGASFTIAAAAGTHCDFGLPAFNGSRDFVQLASEIAGTEYLTTQRSPSLDALTSKWNSRGWTLQENLLSKRLLVFTETQVFFRCNLALWCEDVSAECQNSLFKLTDGRWLNRQVSRTKSPLGYARRQWETFVPTLLTRDFTVDSDILNAFRGVSKTLEPQLGGFHWGLPENNFDRALLWHTDAPYPTERRPGFPSWSWAGWKHSALTRVKGPSNRWVYDLDQTSVVTFFHFTASGKLVPLYQCQDTVLEKLPTPIKGHLICDAPPNLDPRRFQNPGQLLVFWTSSATIPLEWKGPNLYAVAGERLDNYFFPLSDEWFEKQPNGMVEIIVISTHPHGPSGDGSEWSLESLIIEWVDGIAYRVQLLGQNLMYNQDFYIPLPTTRKLVVLG